MLPICRYAETQVDTVLDRRDKDMMRKACSFMAENQYKYTVHTRHLTCPRLFAHIFSLRADFLCWFTLQDTRHHENTMNNMKKMPNVWKHTWHLTTFPGQADKSMHLHFQRTAPTHTEDIAELRRVKLGNDSGYKADQSMAAYISL